MESGRILVANLSKGALGDEPSHLIGSLLVSEFQRAAMQRGSQAEETRRACTLIIDEFQNFTTVAFASILSEARKFRLSLVLSHQFTSQLEPEIRDAVFGNIGTTVAFQLSASDAEIMAKEYADTFAANQFVHLDRFHVLLKPCSIDGSDFPFRLRSESDVRPSSLLKHSIIRTSRERYASPRAKVEANIARWIRRWSKE